MISVCTEDYSYVGLREKSNLNSDLVDYNKSIFKTNSFEYKYDERKVYYNEGYKTPREIFEEFQVKQGIFGQTINKLKNIFPIFAMLGMRSAEEVEKILIAYENDDILEYIAQEEVEKYIKNQTMLKEFFLNFITLFFMLLSFTLLQICEVNTNTAMIFVFTFCGAVRLAFEKLETSTNSIAYNYKTQLQILQKIAR